MRFNVMSSSRLFVHALSYGTVLQHLRRRDADLGTSGKRFHLIFSANMLNCQLLSLFETKNVHYVNITVCLCVSPGFLASSGALEKVTGGCAGRLLTVRRRVCPGTSSRADNGCTHLMPCSTTVKPRIEAFEQRSFDCLQSADSRQPAPLGPRPFSRLVIFYLMLWDLIM